MKRILAIMICLVLLVQVGGCGTKQSANGGKKTDKITVWSAPSTVKV